MQFIANWTSVATKWPSGITCYIQTHGNKWETLLARILSPVTFRQKSTVTDAQLKLGNRNVANFYFEFPRDICLPCGLSPGRYNSFGGSAECFLLRLSVTDVAVYRKNSSGNVRHLRSTREKAWRPESSRWNETKGERREIPDSSASSRRSRSLIKEDLRAFPDSSRNLSSRKQKAYLEIHTSANPRRFSHSCLYRRTQGEI